MKAIVLAAGKGMRLGGGASDVPKVMRQLGGKPMLRHVLDSLSFIPEKDTAIVVGYKKEAVTAIGGDYIYPVQEPQLGTGDAVKAALAVFRGAKDNVLVCYGDMPLISRGTFEGLIESHRNHNADCTVLTANVPSTELEYGRIIRESGRLVAIVEHRDCTPEQRKIGELNVGAYVLRIPVLEKVIGLLATNNDQREYLLTDIPKLLLKRGMSVDTHTINNSNEAYGVNNADELALCEEIFTAMNAATLEKRRLKWFGTGGWRALIAEDFTKANVQILAQAMADDMKSKGWGAVVIGHDRRFLSDKAAVWAAEVFAGNDITAYVIGRIAPTPLIMFTVKRYGVKYGMAVTASHNPADYNGIKVFTEGGRDASAEITDLFEGIIAEGVAAAAVPFDAGMSAGKIHVIDPNNDYIDSIIAMIDMDAIRKGGMRILIDPMFGVSKSSLQTILMTARCEVDSIHDTHDTLFGGRLPSPSAATLTRLSEMVVEREYDLGIATDGDADRIGVIDNNGRFVHPNEILLLLYYYLLKYKNWRGDCVRNIATTHLLDKVAADFGQKCHEVPVGFKHISSRMEETDALIGGESSGGLTIRGHIMGKDGIFASALIVEMLSVTGKNIPGLLDDIAAKYGTAYMAEFDAHFSEERKRELTTLLFEDKKLPRLGEKVERVSYEDGLKLYFENGGWIIMRFSGTEPLLRIFCEMATEAEAEACLRKAREFLRL